MKPGDTGAVILLVIDTALIIGIGVLIAMGGYA